jgi:hypothetical protein
MIEASQTCHKERTAVAVVVVVAVLVVVVVLIIVVVVDYDIGKQTFVVQTSKATRVLRRPTSVPPHLTSIYKYVVSFQQLTRATAFGKE